MENFNKNTFFLHEMDKVVLMSIKWLNKIERPLVKSEYYLACDSGVKNEMLTWLLLEATRVAQFKIVIHIYLEYMRYARASLKCVIYRVII